jgi:hypothetical protein
MEYEPNMLDVTREPNGHMNSTARSRLTRLRQRRGLRVVPVEVFEAEVHWLVTIGLLAESDRGDVYQIGRAIEKVIEQAARN